MMPVSSTDAVVECHSGYAYAQRPRAFEWEGQWLEVETLASEWQTPEGKHFRVRTKHGKIFELVYDLARDAWEVFDKT